MRWSREVSVVLPVLAGLLLAAGWYNRAAIHQRLWPPSRPVPTTTLVYTWSDRQGTVHFSESSAPHSRVIVVDTSRITPIEPPTGSLTPPAGAKVLAAGKGGEGDDANKRANLMGQPTDNN